MYSLILLYELQYKYVFIEEIQLELPSWGMGPPQRDEMEARGSPADLH